MLNVGRLGCLVALAASVAAATVARADVRPVTDAVQHGVADKASGRIQVADRANHRVQVFRTRSGTA
jgi:hypothetical protein